MTGRAKPLDEQAIVADYLDGMQLYQLIRRHHTSVDRIKLALEHRGYVWEKTKPRKRLSSPHDPSKALARAVVGYALFDWKRGRLDDSWFGSMVFVWWCDAAGLDAEWLIRKAQIPVKLQVRR